MKPNSSAVTAGTDVTWKAGSVYPLSYPIELKTTSGEEIETISELKFRRLTGADLAAVSNAGSEGQGAVLRTMICRACNIGSHVFDRMDAEDVMRVSEVVNGFFSAAPRTGET